MPEVSAILLAAGLSRRMGKRNKLLLPINGEPMVRLVAETYLKAVDGSVTVVTGFDAERVRKAVAGLPLLLADNPAFETGQSSSVVTGLKHAPVADLLLIGLADQPWITPDDLVRLIDTHRRGNPEKATVPMHDGRRGNPVVIPSALRPRMIEMLNRPGCVRFTRDYPEFVQAAELSSRGYYKDIDVPADYEALTNIDRERAE